jgi:hypothetical protein
VEEEADGALRGVQVVVELTRGDRVELVGGFRLDDEAAFHQHVEPVGA